MNMLLALPWICHMPFSCHNAYATKLNKCTHFNRVIWKKYIEIRCHESPFGITLMHGSQSPCSTPEIFQLAHIITVVADVLVPNRHQAIKRHHTDMTVTILCMNISHSKHIASQSSNKLQATGLILGLHSANERRRHKVTASLIGWAQT